jgi:hypothetical protein
LLQPGFCHGQHEQDLVIGGLLRKSIADRIGGDVDLFVNKLAADAVLFSQTRLRGRFA